MGSISIRRIAVPLTALLLALAPSANAMLLKDYSKNGATGSYAPAVVHKNYSLNGATGDYAPAINTRVPSTPIVSPAPHDDGFAWGDALLGAGVALLVVLLAGMTTRRVRRRRVPAPAPARPTTA
jgi:hypothetical protein